MRAVVSDTGPLNYLILIEATWILPRLFASVTIPTAVKEELSRREAPAVVRAWIARPPAWLTVARLTATIVPGVSDLHAGEREVLTHASEQPELLVLMDDRRATVEARHRGMDVIGTLAVLDRAAANGWINLSETFTRLRATSFRSPLRLMARTLEQDALRKK
jgi:predicted nucleic acid-binding protein